MACMYDAPPDIYPSSEVHESNLPTFIMCSHNLGIVGAQI